MRNILKIAIRRISSVQKIPKGIVMKSVMALYRLNPTAYRFIVCALLVHLGGSLLFNGLSDPQVMLGVSEYLQQQTIRPDEQFSIYGVVVPGSLEYVGDINSYLFEITDFQRKVSVIYGGGLRAEFKEGQNLIMTASYQDSRRKDQLVCHSYINNHSMEGENWEGSTSKFKRDVFVNKNN